MSRRHTLTDQETALSLYLDALFAPMREAAEAEEAQVAEALASTSPAPERAAAQATQVGETPEADAPATTPPLADGFRGDCLVAEHRQLRLALPMQALAAILPAPVEYARLPGQAAWLHGVVRHRGVNVPVVSADVLAARTADEEAPPAGRDAQVVVLGSGRWAVHLDHVAETRAVAPADYRLRGQRERLPWLAGYLTQGLVSLIDVAELEAWLDGLAHGTDTAETRFNGR